MRALVLSVLLGLSGAVASSAVRADFYTPDPGSIPGRPGSLIRAERFPAPAGAAAAYRVLYRSTGFNDQPVAVSGVVVVPKGVAPPGGRPLVSWAPATSGVARGCARSSYPNVYASMYGLPHMLARGFVVVATDYPGLGTPGVHPYLIGDAQGHAVLDAARAARALPEAEAGSRFAAAGYSQGAHASLFAANLARSYAPELKLIGVAASAPPTDLGALIREAYLDPIGRVFTTFALASWSKIYGVPLDTVLEKRVSRVFNNIASRCNMTGGESLKLMFAEQAFEREGFLKEDITMAGRWRELLARNSAAPTPRDLPVFLAQGSGDQIVLPEVTQRYAARLCARRSPVTLLPVRGGHYDSGPAAAKPMTDWLARRFAGEAPRTTCGSVEVSDNGPTARVTRGG